MNLRPPARGAIDRVALPEDKEVTQSMIQHESAILTWLDLESAGPNERSLDAMIALVAVSATRARRRLISRHAKLFLY